MGLADFPCSSQLIIVGCLCFCLGVIVATAIILIGWVAVQWKKHGHISSSSSTSSECEAYRQNRRNRQLTCSSHTYHTARDLILQNSSAVEVKSNKTMPSLPSSESLGIISDINLNNAKGPSHLTLSNAPLQIDCATPPVFIDDHNVQLERHVDSYGSMKVPPRLYQRGECCDKWSKQNNSRNSANCFNFNMQRASQRVPPHEGATSPFLYGGHDIDSIVGIPEYPAPVPATDASVNSGSPGIPYPESEARRTGSPSWSAYFYERMQLRPIQQAEQMQLRPIQQADHRPANRTSSAPRDNQANMLLIPNSANIDSSSPGPRSREVLRQKSSCLSRLSSGEYMAMRQSALLAESQKTASKLEATIAPSGGEELGEGENYLYAKPLTKKQREKAAKAAKRKSSNYQTL